MITGQPLVVFSPTPAECSTAVAALLSLISPIPYSTDFRPYYTIHDPTFNTLLRKHEDAKRAESMMDCKGLPTLIGITNLFFIKSMPLWPNIVSVGQKQPTLKSLTHPNNALSKTISSRKKFNPKTAFNSFKSRMLKAQVLLSQHVENIWVSEKTFIKPDNELCKDIEVKAGTGHLMHLTPKSNALSESLKKHFWTLTTSFLEPFQGYFVPVEAAQLCGYMKVETMRAREASGLPEFDPSEFLSSLNDWPFPQILRDRFNSFNDLISFYEIFISSTNFRVWFSRQQSVIAKDLGLSNLNFSDYENSKFSTSEISDSVDDDHSWDCTDEVRLVEEFIRLENELMNEMYEISTSSGDMDEKRPRTKQESDFIKVFSAMPGDLQKILLSSPGKSGFVERLSQIPGMREKLRSLSLDTVEMMQEMRI